MEFPMMVGNVAVKTRRELMELAETDVTAQYILGEAFYNGDGVPQDDKKAFFYSSKAAEQKNTQAMINLSYLCKKAIGCKRDVLRAERLLLEAEKLGDDEAFAWLAEMYLYGMGPVKQDTKKAFDYINKALNSSFDSEFLLRNLGIEKDYFFMIYEMMKANEIPQDFLNELTMMLRSDSLDEYNEE